MFFFRGKKILFLKKRNDNLTFIKESSICYKCNKCNNQIEEIDEMESSKYFIEINIVARFVYVLMNFLS